jgi:exodeoxyribonuclease V alpha subunit
MPSLETQSDFSFISKDNPKDIAEAVVGVYRTARMNGTEGSLQVLTPERKNGAGVNMLNNTLQRTLNPNWSKDDTANSVTASKVKIFAGDKVMYTKNEVELGLVNGSIGVVMEASTDRFTVAATVRFAGESNPRAEETGEDPEVFHLEGEYVQPLILAYAMTVHKAQGSEWSQIAVICEKSHTSMRRRLLYTAITRTSKNLLIIGDAASVRRAAQRNEDENRKTLLVQRLKAQGQ